MSPYELWDGYMRSYDFLTDIDGYARNLNDIALRANVERGSRVLDAGSGTGNLSILMKRAGARVSSCDFCFSAIQKHREKDPDADLQQLSLEESLPYPDGHFDAVCCASVLFALSQVGCKRAVKEFFRVTRPGGKVVITVPAKEAGLFPLVKMHIASKVRKLGVLHGVWAAAIAVPALLRVLYYNKKLRRMPDWSGFHAFKEDELKYLTRESGFQDIQCCRTYGNVFLLVAAEKPRKQKNAF